MPSSDTYLKPAAPAETQLTEKRSKFLAFVVPVSGEEEAKTALEGFRKKYFDARHVCYAYVCGTDSALTRSSDDGEPSGTAGRPILNQILAHGLTDTLAVVVRYFGGVKLGTGPLAVAYKTAAAEALEAAPVKECVMTADFGVEASYTDADTAMRYVREAGAEIAACEYTADGMQLRVRVRLSDEAALRGRLAGLFRIRLTD